MNNSLLNKKQDISQDTNSAQKSNDFQTPYYAIRPLINVIPIDSIIWECAVGEGYMQRAFESEMFNVVSSDIKTGTDFLNIGIEYPVEFDCIVTNPPYLPRGIKDAFLKKCYWWYINWDKPFALLMPLSTIEGKTRQFMYQKYGLQIILMDKRINFITPNKIENSSAWFATAWFTCGFNLSSDITYYNFNKE